MGSSRNADKEDWVKQKKLALRNNHLGHMVLFRPVLSSFSNTALATHLPTDLTKLQRGKQSLLMSGAIPKDIVALTSQGSTVYTDKGPVIDLTGMTANCILGLNDPWVRLKQVAYLISDQPHYVNVRLGFPLYYTYPERLAKLLTTAGFNKPVINHRQCNGSDAIELAIHAASVVARPEPNKRKLASFKGSYHGENLLACLISEHQPSRFLVNQPTTVNFFEAPTYAKDKEKVLSESAERTLATLQERGDEYFAVIIEPIQWRNAVHVCPVEFLQALRKVCDQKNICLIFDEVQTGFGYLGKFSASEYYGVTPDIAVFSKAITAGHGALAIMVTHQKYKNIDLTFSGKTNASDVLTLVAADAVLDRLWGIPKETIPEWLPENLKQELETGLISKVPLVSAKLLELLEKLRAHFPNMTGQIRGCELLRGLEILSSTGKPDEKMAAWLVNQAFDEGIYIRQAAHALLFKPGLMITDEEFQISFEQLSKAFEKGVRYREECERSQKPLIVPRSHL